MDTGGYVACQYTEGRVKSMQHYHVASAMVNYDCMECNMIGNVENIENKCTTVNMRRLN